MSSKVRLLIAYQGTRYHGWQVQPNEPSVQGTLEQAFTRMTGLSARITAAGRTDAGVHAAGQMACLENLSRHEPGALQAGLNALLPEDVVVLRCEPAEDGFDPRRQAVGKHYRYRIHNDSVRPLFARQFCWHLKTPLDLAAMREAAKFLVGTHDFSSFRSAGCESKSPIRRVDRLDISVREPEIVMDFMGSGFLKQMVRNLVGSLTEVGRRHIQPSEIKEILEARDRTRAGLCAPARGLCLMRVFYQTADYQLILDNPDQFP